ncbi:hypothetical protein GE061_011234 [Apolygus lucorum]|uniref:ER membrane protein complex subunit 2 n=1 Tax=Apolygus lucorum TaxID=248454 RepID=A0A6A4JRP8_APOLU|nr:hypothetical protein GE061_011234 [Apolygus lucorum]
MHWSEARDLVRKWREDNARKSQELVEIWESTLKDKVHKLGDEQFQVLEQVCIGAIDCHRIDVAEYCLKKLTSQFKDSSRILLLSAMEFEAVEMYDDAIEILDAMIKRDETNPAPRKRKIAILRSRGRTIEAIKALTDYLKRFAIDQEAWQELCDLYLIEQEYGKAAFCMEELILHNPHNHLFHERLAEIRYTQGGFDNLESARSYYCQALKLNRNNMRALFGLYLTAYSIATSQKCVSAKKKEAHSLMSWAMKRISQRYKETAADKSQIDALEGLMGSLQLGSNSNL